MDVNSGQVFHLLKIYRIAWGALAGLIAGWQIAFFDAALRSRTGNPFPVSSGYPAWILFVLVPFFIILMGLYNAFFARLTLTSEGIEYNFWLGFRRAKWRDASRIGKHPSMTYPRVMGIYFKRTTEFSFSRDRSHQKFIPLGWFVKDWQNSSQVETILQWAPQLTEPSEPGG